MEVLADKTAPIEVRLTALQYLGAAHFASPVFAAHRVSTSQPSGKW